MKIDHGDWTDSEHEQGGDQPRGGRRGRVAPSLAPGSDQSEVDLPR